MTSAFVVLSGASAASGVKGFRALLRACCYAEHSCSGGLTEKAAHGRNE
jgi:hypothetical protein